MTKKQTNFKIGLIKSVHCSAMYKEVYADDRELYEGMLQRAYGVKSSKELGIEELVELSKFLNKKGELRLAPNKVYATKNQVSFIKSCWRANSRNKDLIGLLKLVKKIVKRDVNSVSKIYKSEAGGVISAVKSIKPDVPVNNS